MNINEIKEFLKNKYPNYKGVIEHTLVAEMAKTYAEYYFSLQLQQAGIISSCNLHAKEIIKKLTMRPHLEDKEGFYDMVNDETQMIKIVEEYLLKNYKNQQN